jgi:hypothetical protein
MEKGIISLRKFTLSVGTKEGRAVQVGEGGSSVVSNAVEEDFGVGVKLTGVIVFKIPAGMVVVFPLQAHIASSKTTKTIIEMRVYTFIEHLGCFIFFHK